jgi:hypothetical protein
LIRRRSRYIARKVTFASFFFKTKPFPLLAKGIRGGEIFQAGKQSEVKIRKQGMSYAYMHECVVFTYMYLSIYLSTYLHPLNNKEKKSALSIMSFSIHASSFLLICLTAYE